MLAVIFLSFFPPTVFAADIEAVTDSADGSSAFTVKSSANVVQTSVDSTGNLVTKGCVRIDNGLIECSDAESLIVDGSIGLGTVNPLSKLQVSGGLSRFGLAGSVDFASGTGDVYVQNNMEVDNVFFGNKVLASGNVGIGTTSPQAVFQMVGGDALIGTGTFNNTSVSPDLYVTGHFE
ncbi:MAG: hypothetical protein JNN05_05465, partial [Candidatus Omnitrophica bacterium]|nr:hypothetical protein [Candidatus Omnitrophota bacterium]